jgi:hypothetical protein
MFAKAQTAAIENSAPVNIVDGDLPVMSQVTIEWVPSRLSGTLKSVLHICSPNGSQTLVT